MCKEEKFFSQINSETGDSLKDISLKDGLGIEKINFFEKTQDCSISNMIPFPVWVLSPEKILTFFNKAFLSLWGFADNKKIREVCLEDVADKFFIRFCSTLADKVLDGKIAIESKCWMIDARGQYKFLNIKALPYLDIHNEIEFIVFSAVDCTSFKNDNERIKRAGQVDPLTGLFNRRAFDKKITSMEKEAIFPLILAVADVDNLKKINDEEGHLVGDEFLKDCGKFLKENFRENDFIARIGGDEFCVILPGCSIEAMKKILRRISQKSQCLNFSLGWDNKRYRAESIKEVFKRADKNMYQQKAIKKSS